MDLRGAVAELRAHLSYLDVSAAAPPAGARPLAGPLEDPTAVQSWIADYQRVTVAQSGIAPPGMPSAFVLQYHLDPWAQVMATAADRAGWIPDGDPRGWWLVLDPTYLYPLRVHLSSGDRADGPSREARLARAREAYLSHAIELADAFPAEGRMSSRQRSGMARDMWHIAVARLSGAPPPARESCCLMYALPGVHPCAGCPRQTTADGTPTDPGGY